MLYLRCSGLSNALLENKFAAYLNGFAEIETGLIVPVQMFFLDVIQSLGVM